MKILSVSDKVDPRLYTSFIDERYQNADLIIACGDLPYYYVEFLVDALKKPVVYVRGNHEAKYEVESSGDRKTAPLGATDLHNKIIYTQGVLIGGFEGSIRYRKGPFMYSQSQMWWMVLKKIPRLLFNKIFYGRYLDIFVTHSPPYGIGDKDDFPHQGFKAYVWFLKTFKPKLHFHGHIHLYDMNEKWMQTFEQTRIINSYGIRIMNVETW